MKYVSTRGGDEATFAEAIARGYARDGGLYMPELVPHISLKDLEQWKYHSFALLCEEIMAKFVEEEVPRSDLRQMMTRCFGSFANESVVPLKHLPGAACGRADDVWVAELFHGPSLSFKDFGQQVLCCLLDYFARRNKSKVSLLVSTTGDTGPAAICAAGGLRSLQLVVTYPFGQISRVQELQMTTQQAENVYVFAFEGGGDDMDAPIKALSTDQEFQKKHGLSSVNSINIGRVVAQTVHYFWSYLRIIETKGLAIGAPLQFALPCGALGNASAALLATKMGLPISNIFCGTNDNDIFHRAISEGDFSRRAQMVRTLSEAINIQVPYNFERILYLISGHDSSRIAHCMNQLQTHGRIDLASASTSSTSPPDTASIPLGTLLQQYYVSTRVSDSEMLAEMKRTWDTQDYITDPHTAVALVAARKLRWVGEEVVVLATAHPCKFDEALKQGLGGQVVSEQHATIRPPQVQDLMTKPEVRHGVFRAGDDWESQIRTMFETDVWVLPTKCGGVAGWLNMVGKWGQGEGGWQMRYFWAGAVVAAAVVGVMLVGGKSRALR